MGFRCIVLQASNLPDKVPPRFNDSCMVVPRAELQVWQQLIARGAGQVLRFGDYAIVHPRQTDSDKPVVPPPRVRFATQDAYRLYRAEVDQARSLAGRVCEDPAYYAAGDSWGMQEVRASAGGFGGPGAGPQWVARDTNHHLECTAALVRQALMRGGRLHELSLAPAMREPWLQQLLQ